MHSLRPICSALALVLVAACTSDAPPKTESSTSPWLRELMETAQREPITNPPVVFLSYRYRGQSVVYRPPYCCDIQGVVYAETGAKMCHPDGGFTGEGDGRCRDFAALATDCAVLWRDPRAKKPGRDLCAIRDTRRPPLE